MTTDTVKITDEDAVKEAQAAYDKLSEAAKVKLETQSKLLTALQNQIDSLKGEEADKKRPENVTTNDATTYRSVSINFKEKISKINSLSVSLLNKNKGVLSTNTLNELGHFLNGTAAGTQDPKYTVKLTPSNLTHYQEVLNNKELKVDQEVQMPADGDYDKISTSFIYGNPAFDGMDDKTNLSSWNKGEVPANKNDITYVRVTIDGVSTVYDLTGNVVD